jgi:hypothetical protein
MKQLADVIEITIQQKKHLQVEQQLNDFRDASPLITALQKQGSKELITILAQAQECSLRALARLTHGTDFTLLIESFLIKNSKDLELVQRNRLTQLLLQPDFSGWLARKIDSLIEQSATLISLKLLRLISAHYANELHRLTDLRTCISSYSSTTHLDIFWTVCHYYQDLLRKDLFSPVSNTYILLFYKVLHTMDLANQIEFINGLSQEHLLLIVDHCLSASNQKDNEKHQIYSELLFLLCSQYVLPNTEYLVKVKARLNQHDLYLFDTLAQYELAKKELPSEQTSPINLNHGSFWVQQILTSPRFVAHSSPTVLKKLSARYGLFLLTLTPTEFNEFSSLNSAHSSYMEDFQERMVRINQQLNQHPEAKTYWLAKRYHLLKFGLERTVQALFYQLEGICTQQQNEPLENDKLFTADNALRILYGYYCQIYENVRSDIFLLIIDHAYCSVLKTTIECRSDQHLPWIKRKLSPFFESLPLTIRQKEVDLYNSAGQKIGFIVESNQALTFVDDEPISLAQTQAVQINEVVYNIEGQELGYLTPSGELRTVKKIEQHICTHILNKVPIIELQHAPKGLELLVQHALFENSLELLTLKEQINLSSSKTLWLERKVSQALQETEKTIDFGLFKSMVCEFSTDTLFSVLAHVKNQTNAFQLFHNILNQENQRNLLFSGLYESDFQQFLKRQDASICLANYLINFYNNTWFAEGLLHFAHFSKKHHMDHLLSEALDALTEFPEGKRQDLLQRLITTEDCAAVVLKEFFNDCTSNPVQEVQNPEISKVTRYFNKQLVVKSLHILNNTSHWDGTSQYKLLLHVLNNNHVSLFPAHDINLISQSTWQNNELDEMALFISRHLGKKRALDKEHVIGHRILGELLFICPKFGQTTLFYYKNKLNKSLARLSFTRTFLEKLIDKFCIPECFKEQIADDSVRMKSWLNEQNSLTIKDDCVLREWRILVLKTWKENNKKKLPALCAYLLIYAGKRKPLLNLLQDYFTVFKNHNEYLHPVTQLLQQFPDRDLSFALFDALEVAVIEQADILDGTVLSDMAHYYINKIVNTDLKSPEAELSLLTYFGQNKHYEVVQKGCEELIKICDDEELKKRLMKGATEALVEASLRSSLDSFFFVIIKVFKRLWYYGFNAEKNASNIVTFCDDATPGPTRKKSSNDIKIPENSMRTRNAHLGFKEKRANFINLLRTIKLCSINKSFEMQPFKAKHTLFTNTDKAETIKLPTMPGRPIDLVAELSSGSRNIGRFLDPADTPREPDKTFIPCKKNSY